MLLDCREEMKVDWTCISNKSTYHTKEFLVSDVFSFPISLKKGLLLHEAYNKIHSN